jgi:flagella basal body P-ring formation protein FlgA
MIRVIALLLLGGVACTTSGAAERTASAGTADSSTIAIARAHLLDHLRQVRPDIERFELTLIGHPPSFARAVVAADGIHGNVLSPRTCVWLSADRGGRSIGSVPIWFAVKAYRPVLVSLRNREARDSIDGGDFVVEERDVASLSGAPLEVDADLARLRARHIMTAGRIVLKNDLEEMPQVLRGQEVTVEVKHGSVEIETSAVALREARLGEPVTLQNPSSHLTYAARVVGQGRAAVIQ